MEIGLVDVLFWICAHMFGTVFLFGTLICLDGVKGFHPNWLLPEWIPIRFPLFAGATKSALVMSVVWELMIVYWILSAVVVFALRVYCLCIDLLHSIRVRFSMWRGN